MTAERTEESDTGVRHREQRKAISMEERAGKTERATKIPPYLLRYDGVSNKSRPVRLGKELSEKDNLPLFQELHAFLQKQPFGFRQAVHLFRQQRSTDTARFRRRIVVQILFQRQQSVRRTEVMNQLLFAQRHKIFPYPAVAVTRSAETRHISQRHQPAHDFVKTAVIRNLKLGAVRFRLRVRGITADAGSGTAADLRNTKL